MTKALLLLALVTVAFAEDLNAIGDTKGYKLWRDRGGTSGRDLTIYEPVRSSSDYVLLGQRAQPNYNGLDRKLHSFKDVSRRRDAFVRPTGFSFIWDDRGSSYFDDASIWRPICPRGYVSLGDFLARKNRVAQPPSELYAKVRCVADDMAQSCEVDNLIWNNSGTIGSYYVSLWGVRTGSSQFDTGFFYARNQHNEKPTVRPWCLRDRAVREV